MFDDPSKVLESVLADGSYQTELPEPLVGTAGAGMPDLPDALVVVLVVVCLLALLILLILVVRGTQLTAPAGDKPVRRREARSRIREAAQELLPDPVALARSGHFGPAVHAVLLHAMSSLRAAGVLIQDSWTSRRVVREAGLSDSAQVPLRGLVDRCEGILFAGRPATEEDYEQSRGDLQTLDRELARKAS